VFFLRQVSKTVAAVHDCETNLCRIGAHGVEKLGPEWKLPDEQWFSLAVDAQGALWVRGIAKLYRLPRGSRTFVRADAGLPSSGILEGGITATSDGTLLVPTASGLAMSRENGWTVIGARQGLGDGEVTSAIEDREGSIWIGFLGSVLARWLGRREWEGWTTAEGLSNNTVWAIHRDPRGRLWAGTSAGLNLFDPVGRRWRTPAGREGMAGENISALASAPDGTLWIGSSHGGLKHLDASGRLSAAYGAASGLTISRVQAVAVDADTHIWVAGSGGIFRGDTRNADGRPRFVRQDIPGSTTIELSDF
jgi:ligand-binding sensor domain-containing protein